MTRKTPKPDYWQKPPTPRTQLVLFAESLESRIPHDHPVRVLDEILDRIDWKPWEARYDLRSGRPPIHPSVLAKTLLFAMIRRIQSSRQIEYNLKHSIDFMWLACGREIDHTTISEFRRKHPEQLKGLYKNLIRLAVDLGVAKLSELCIDGSRVLADASRFNTLTAEKASRLIEKLDRQIAEAMAGLEANDAADDQIDTGQPADRLPEELRDMTSRREKLDELKAELDEMDERRRRDGINPKKNPAQLSPTDPDSRVLPNKEGGYAPNYTPMAVTETENGFVVGADVLIGNVEHTAMVPMLEELESDFETKVETVMGDGAYGTGENIEAMEQRKTELLSPTRNDEPKDNPADREDPTEPVADEDLDRLPINPQTKRFGKHAFVYDEPADCYFCPAGKKLTRSGSGRSRRNGLTVRQVNYVCKACRGCPLGDRCRQNPSARRGRKVTRDGYEAVRRRHFERMQDADRKERYKRRFHFGETPFAVVKASFDLRRFLLRGIEAVRLQWLWSITTLNLKKLMSLWRGVCATSSESPLVAGDWKS